MINNEPTNIQLPQEEGIDIKKYIFLIFSNWWWFAIAMFVSITISYLINRYSQEVYSASCSIIVGEPESGAGSVENILDELARARGKRRKAVVENEISILKSYKMARLALEDLNFDVEYIGIGRRGIAETRLYNNCPIFVEIDTIYDRSQLTPITIKIIDGVNYRVITEGNSEKESKFGEVVHMAGFSYRVFLRNKDNYKNNYWSTNNIIFIVKNINSLANKYRNALSVGVNGEKGSILTVTLSDYVPQQIVDYLNKLCEVYILSNLHEKNIKAENTISFIDDQLRGIVDSLEVTGLRLQRFRSDNKVINLSREGVFLFEKMQDLQSEKAALDIKDRYYSYLLDYIEKRGDYSDVVAPSVIGIADNLLNTLVTTLNQSNLQRRNLSLSVAENSPQLVILNSQINNTKNALEENLKSLVESNTIAVDELNERISAIEKEVQKLPGTERQLINIEREFTINDQIYTYLLEKRAEAGISRASNTSDHKILDIARLENVVKIKPKSSANYFMAFALGISLPLLLLVLIEFFNNKITDRSYLEDNLKAPIIGNIGHNSAGTELPVNDSPNSSLSESFRALRTNLQYMLKGPNNNVIAVSSAISGEGKTFTSVNLATILSMAGKKTLLVSLDLRKPKVHKIFNLENNEGMSTYLIGKTPIAKLYSETNINNLYISTSGPVPPNPSELLSSDAMETFISEAKKSFDYVILDTPPIAIVTDTLTIKNLIDAFVFVIRHKYSEKQVINLINNIHEKKLINNSGVVVNDIILTGYYGYAYSYGYSYSNKYYSDEIKPKSFINRLFRK